MAQQLLQQGILPSYFYDNSFSDMQDALKAKSRKERVQDPLKLLQQAGLM